MDAQTLSAAPVAASEVSPAQVKLDLMQKLSARFGGQALARAGGVFQAGRGGQLVGGLGPVLLELAA